MGEILLSFVFFIGTQGSSPPFSFDHRGLKAVYFSFTLNYDCLHLACLPVAKPEYRVETGAGGACVSVFHSN